METSLETKLAELADYLRSRMLYEKSSEIIRPGCLFKKQDGDVILVIKVDKDSLISAKVQNQPCPGCLVLAPESTGLNYPLYASMGTTRLNIGDYQLRLLARIYDPCVYKSTIEHYFWSVIWQDLNLAWLHVSEGVRRSIEMQTSGICPMPCGPVLPSFSFCSSCSSLILAGFSEAQRGKSAKIRLWIIHKNNAVTYRDDFVATVGETGIPLENITLCTSDHLAWSATVGGRQKVFGFLWLEKDFDAWDVADLISKGCYQLLLENIIQLAYESKDAKQACHNFALYLNILAKEKLADNLFNCNGMTEKDLAMLKTFFEKEIDKNEKLIDAFFGNLR